MVGVLLIWRVPRWMISFHVDHHPAGLCLRYRVQDPIRKCEPHSEHLKLEIDILLFALRPLSSCSTCQRTLER